MTLPDASDSADGEGLDSSDKPPHGINVDTFPPPPHPPPIPPMSGLGDPRSARHQSSAVPNPTFSSLKPSVPLPPPEDGSYPKEPGHTRPSLANFLMATDAAVNGNKAPSTPSSPSYSESEPESHPSTRPPSQAPSRAPSMSAGVSGGKVAVPASKPAIKDPPWVPPPVPPPPEPDISHLPAKGKTPSVHSGDGSHKFTLKDLLASGPKLVRKSSQRSAGSGKKSDSDSGARSVAGDSAASLSKKYGVCQKVAIGKGATSVVRLAHKWDRSEEKLYAVKEFRKRRKTESEKEYVKKLTSEFCISSTLHHVNIVETVDLMQDENHKWCEVMEFCPGGDLYAAIKKGGMSPSEVECCFKQILSGVEYLHSQGVAHRDIKPENLFFDTKCHLKIGDYGASTVYRLPWQSTIHMSTGLCGSEPYIAPEQFLGKPYDARLVDIWACGIVYYCLHFQELPWRVAQVSDPLYASYAQACASPQQAQSACPPTINNLSPRACRPLLRKMLEPDAKHRSPIDDVMTDKWLQTIEVCHAVPKPTHVHVHARAMIKAQMANLVHDT